MGGKDRRIRDGRVRKGKERREREEGGGTEGEKGEPEARLETSCDNWMTTDKDVLQLMERNRLKSRRAMDPEVLLQIFGSC